MYFKCVSDQAVGILTSMLVSGQACLSSMGLLPGMSVHDGSPVRHVGL